MDTFSTCHERKPRLHDGTVTEDTDKYWLLRIPPSSREPPDDGLTRIRKAPRTQPSQANSGKNAFACECACAIGTRLNVDLLCVAQNGVVLEPSQNRS